MKTNEEKMELVYNLMKIDYMKLYTGNTEYSYCLNIPDDKYCYSFVSFRKDFIANTTDCIYSVKLIKDTVFRDIVTFNIEFIKTPFVIKKWYGDKIIYSHREISSYKLINGWEEKDIFDCFEKAERLKNIEKEKEDKNKIEEFKKIYNTYY